MPNEPRLTIDDLVSAMSMPNENMVVHGNAIGADIVPKRPIGDLTQQAALPPWMMPIMMAIGFRGRRSSIQGSAPNTNQASPMQTIRPPSRPSTEIGSMVRAHHGVDRNQLVNPRTFPGTPVSGQQASSPNIRANSYNEVVEALRDPMDRLTNRRILTPSNTNRSPYDE